MTVFKYNVGDRIRIVSCGEKFWWYANLIGNEYTITNLCTLQDGPNYAVDRAGANVVSEYNVELVVAAQPVAKNLRAVAEEVAILDALQAEAEASLKRVVGAREALLKELQGFGLTLVGAGVVIAPMVAQTLRELYASESVEEGDQFTWTAPDNEDRDWTQGRSYTILRVDYDNSVLITSDRCEEWAWENEGAFDGFVKVV